MGQVMPFEAWHYECIADPESLAAVAPQALKAMEQENSWTAAVDGKVLICAGTLQQWPGRHTAWAYLAAGILPHMQWVTEQVLLNLQGLKGRIEMTVRADFKPGMRWAKRLGFAVETPLLAKYGPFGEDHVGFVRFN